ncbi:hypothetical protein FOL47_003519 [Perkinsus chesapeaki]|uniref:Uncharacterized protein n=1 Tax=Perkinsus chesapeaki TaxID=330153 RepID=A0A7J6MZL0_PERCH|nr:hypothetical protein FOL47_003519 [Perkinsus chesapeaki]
MARKMALVALCALVVSELSGCSSSDGTTTTATPITTEVTTHAAFRTTAAQQTTTSGTTTTTTASTENCMNGDYYCQVMSNNPNSFCRYYRGLRTCQGFDIPCNCDDLPPTTTPPPPTTASNQTSSTEENSDVHTNKAGSKTGDEPF